MSYFVPLKTILGELKTNLAIEMSQNKSGPNTWQIIEMSNSTKQHADINSGNHADL